MAFLDLGEGVGVVVSGYLSVGVVVCTCVQAGWVLRGDGDVAAVENSGPAVEGVRFEGDVVASTGVLVNVHSVGRI